MDGLIGPERLRLRCLELAVQCATSSVTPWSTKDITESAKAFTEFVLPNPKTEAAQ